MMEMADSCNITVDAAPRISDRMAQNAEMDG